MDELVLVLQPEDSTPMPDGDVWAAHGDLLTRGVTAKPHLFIHDGIEDAVTHLGAWTIDAGAYTAPAVAAVACTWLQGHVGRKVRVRYGAVEVEARAPADVEKLLALIPKALVDPRRGGEEA